MNPILKPQLVLILVASAVFFTRLGVPRLWDEDEPRNAACAREMLERGDWVVPTFNYELRAQKPVLLYWLIMSAYSLFGVNEFAARLPSAVLAVGTTLVTFQLGRLLFNIRTGFLAGLMMATCLMFGVAGRAATPDSCLIFFTCLSFWAYVAAVTREDATSSIWRRESLGLDNATAGHNLLPSRWTSFARIYGAMGLATLGKGPVGVLLPTAILGSFLLVVNCPYYEQKKPARARLAALGRHFLATTWSMRPFTLLLVVTMVAGPWYAMVGIRTEGEWIRSFFGTENLARFQTAMEGHGGLVFYYPVAVLVGFFPWSIVLPAGIWFSLRDSTRRDRREAAHLLLAVWAILWIGAFSFAGTKLPSYVLPSYPALALMSAAFVDRWLREPVCVPRWMMSCAWSALIAVGLAMAAALPIAVRKLLPGEEPLALVGLIPIIGGGAALWFCRRKRFTTAICAVSMAAVLLCVSVLAFGAVRVSRHLNSASLVAIARQDGGQNVRFATYAHPESSVVYYARGRVERFNEAPRAVEYLASTSDGYLITNAERFDDLLPSLPAYVGIVAREPRFLKHDEVLLLGRKTQTAAVPTEAPR